MDNRRRIPVKDVKQIVTELTSWTMDIISINEFSNSPVPRDVDVKQKVDKWIDDRIQMVLDRLDKKAVVDTRDEKWEEYKAERKLKVSMKQYQIVFPSAGATHEYVLYCHELFESLEEMRKAWDYKICIEPNWLTYEQWEKEKNNKK